MEELQCWCERTHDDFIMAVFIYNVLYTVYAHEVAYCCMMRITENSIILIVGLNGLSKRDD